MTAQLALLINLTLFAILSVSTVYLAGRTRHNRYAMVAGICSCLALVLMVFIGGLM